MPSNFDRLQGVGEEPAPHVGAGTGTAPGIRHADMHPLTKARVDAQAQVGRTLLAFGEANRLMERGEVTRTYINRKRDEFTEALARLVEAAQNEGAGGN